MAEGREEFEEFEERPADEGRRWLLFCSGGDLFAIEIEHVREVVLEQTVTPVPLAPPAVAGVVNYRGVIFTLMDFALMSGREGRTPGAAVFLHRPGMFVGLQVESVPGIERIPEAALEGVQRIAAGEGGDAPFLTGLLDHGGRVLNLVDGEHLLETILLMPAEDEPAARESERSVVNGS